MTLAPAEDFTPIGKASELAGDKDFEKLDDDDLNLNDNDDLNLNDVTNP